MKNRIKSWLVIFLLVGGVLSPAANSQAELGDTSTMDLSSESLVQTDSSGRPMAPTGLTSTKRAQTGNLPWKGAKVGSSTNAGIDTMLPPPPDVTTHFQAEVWTGSQSAMRSIKKKGIQ